MISEEVYFEKEIYQGKQQSINVHISEGIIKAFAELTGDYSSLHTDQTFARKSMYRESVSHRMLTVAFIASFKNLIPTDYAFSFKKISTRFLKPIFVGDELTINSVISDIDVGNNSVVFEYSVQKKGIETKLTTGYFTLEITPRAEQSPSPSFLNEQQSEKKGLLSETLREQTFQFEDLQKGDSQDFQFKATVGNRLILYDILQQGGDGLLGDPSTWLSHCNPDNLLTTLMLSTFVGMCLPGKHATFIDFQISFQKTTTLTKCLKLAGAIAFKSISTSTIVENIIINEIDSEEASYATAKLTVKVNKPKVTMPLISEIAENDFDLNLKNKTALITGGSGGIGQTIAKYLALHGCKIALHYYRGKDEAERVASEINDNGGQAKVFPANVCDREQVRTMITNAAQQLGNIDILVNNAVRDFYPKSFLELKWDDFQNELDVTLKGAFNCCQEVIPIMIKNQAGKIINISTIAAETPSADQAKYVAAKSALIGLTRSLAVEFAQNKIQVNMIVPSIVKTDLTKHVSDLFFENIKRNIPMKRIATSNDIAKAVIFLSSSLSSYTTGQKIMVTGGIPPFL